MVGNKAQKAVAAALTGMMVLGSAAPAFAGTRLNNDWYRVNGDMDTAYFAGDSANDLVKGYEDYKGKDRYDTMFDAIAYNVEINKVWTTGTPNTQLGKLTNVDSVVLVSGTSYADALAANGLAGVLGAPVISTPADSLGTQAERAIKWFAQNSGTLNKDGNPLLNVYIVGGEAAVSKKVYDAVDGISSVKQQGGSYQAVEVNPVRISGNDRMTTSTSVMRWINQYVVAANKQDINVSNTIFVANGWAWADALSVSSYSYRMGAPLVLTDADGRLSDEQLAYLKTQLVTGARVAVIGGPAQLAYDALVDLGVKGGGIDFLSGDNRYETNALVLNRFGDFGENIAVATGKNWPDALIGGSFIGAQNGTLVLAGEQGETDWSVAVEAAISANNAPNSFANKFILGGTSAVNKETATVLTTMI